MPSLLVQTKGRRCPDTSIANPTTRLSRSTPSAALLPPPGNVPISLIPVAAFQMKALTPPAASRCPTTSPRSFNPYASEYVPPGSRSSIVPTVPLGTLGVQRKACSAPLAVDAVPTTCPASFTDDARLLPSATSVPRSYIVPVVPFRTLGTQSSACRPCGPNGPVMLLSPTTSPMRLIPCAEEAPPPPASVPRLYATPFVQRIAYCLGTALYPAPC